MAGQNSSNLSCQYMIQHGMAPVPDNDISGIGVVVAFIVSAYITLSIVIAAYLFGYIDHNLLRPTDIYVHRRKAHNAYREDAVYIAIRQCTLAFSDQQIVTGIAILTAGFIGFAKNMSVYHFQIVMYLGWMSSSVHLTALTMLATFLRERRPLLGWRVAGMITMFVLLLVALFPTTSSMWAVDSADVPDDSDYTGWAVPAKCFWFETYGQGVNPDGPLGLVILIVSYLWKVGGLFRSSRGAFHAWIRGPIEYWLERLARHEARRLKAKDSIIRTLRYRLVIGTYALVVANFEFFSSFAASLWLSLVGLVFGSAQIIVPRIQNIWWAYQENVWSFGQITPLVLLIQPLGAVMEHMGEGAKEHREELAHGRMRDPIDEEDREKSRNRIIARTRRSSSAAPNREKQLSDVFAELEIKKPVDRPVGDLLGHQRLLYNSYYFMSLIVCIEMAIVVFSAIILYDDIKVIGEYASSSFSDILFLCGCLAAWSVFWFLLWMPFSRVFK